MSINLSMIIPAYNAEPYIHELLDRLEPQITDEVQVIVIDDGSQKPLKIDRPWVEFYKNTQNRGISYTRNKGLAKAKGKLIHFMDADDLVAENYVEYVLDLAESHDFDYMDLSWKSLPGGTQFDYKLRSISDRLPNPSASTRLFKRSFIGDHRFNEKKDACEDEDFTRHLGIRKAKCIAATDYMYFYRTSVEGSNSKRYLAQDRETKRIAYYFNVITQDMNYLIDEVKKEDETNEVFILTNRNDLPELEEYAQVIRPQHLSAFEKRGELNSYITVPPKPIHTQVVVYIRQVCEIGGIETFVYSFCKKMHELYDIIVLYDNIASSQLARLVQICRCVKNSPELPISCDTIIVTRINDGLPRNVKFKKSVQMAHCIKQQPTWHIPQDRDVIVNVSQASKDSFGDEAKNSIVIHNLSVNEKHKKCLFIVSTIRVGADDKQGNDERCRKFARLMKKEGIPFIWMYFGDRAMKDAPEGMYYGGLTHDIKPYVARADYLALLSGSEAFSYSLLEALEVYTPVLVTPLAQNEDMGIMDGKNGYIVPFDVDSFDIKKILKIPNFKYKHNNEEIIKQWQEILGHTVPKGDYKPNKDMAVEVTKEYRDLQRNELMKPGMKCEMPMARALDLQNEGFVRIIG